MNLIEELVILKQQMQAKLLMTGIWENNLFKGSVPHSREGSAGCLIG